MFYHTGWRFRFLQLQALMAIVQFIQIKAKNKPKSVQVIYNPTLIYIGYGYTLERYVLKI